jgi:DNA-binding SARP family transcriptional activator/ABC-type oligopeptide transport system substrate-binding subunit
MAQFRVLGQLEALADGGPVDLGGLRQRAVLAVLLAHANQPVSTERLVTEVWGADAPPTATKTAQVYISRLRRTLGDNSLATTPGGYVLRVASGALDVDEAKLLRERARDAGPREAGRLLRDGLGLWRGPAYADLRYEPALQGEIARLDELQLSMLEERVEADVAAGHTTDLVPELQTLVHEHPLRERLRGSLMLALYRSGRQADALDVFADGRRLLVDELGLEPGPELRELERAILTQDPAIAGPRRSPRLPARRRAGALVALGGALLAVAAVGGVALVLQRDSGAARLVETPPKTLVELDPSTGNPTGFVTLPSDPVALAAGKHALWAASADKRMITRINRGSRAARSVAVELVPSSVAVGADAVWVGGSGSPGLTAVDPVFLRPRDDSPRHRSDWPSSVHALAVGDGSVWAGTDDGVVRIDERSGRVLKEYPAKEGVSALAFGGGVLFAGLPTGRILRIDPVSGISARQHVADWVVGLAVRGRELWAVGRWTTAVWQLDAGNLDVVDSTEVDTEPGGTIANATGIAVSRESTWISSELGVRRLDRRNEDPTQSEIGASRDLAAPPRAIVADGGRVWIAVAERRERAASLAQRTLRFNRPWDGDSSTLDPAIAYSAMDFQREFATCAKLVSYPDRAGPAGLEIVPELARDLPAMSADGLTYTFRVRDDMRFSPPSDAAVTAADVKATIERALSPMWPDDPPGAFFLRDIAGAPDYLAGKAGEISGIAVSGDRLTIRLTRPVPDLLHRLALPFFCVLPKRAPIVAGGLTGPIPTAGPYYLASGRVGDDSHTIVLRRNPNYRGDRPRIPDRIVYSIGPDGTETAGALEAGAADYSDGNMTPATYARLLLTAGPGTPAARAGRQRIFGGRTSDQLYLLLNAARPLFRDARLRRAVAHALDRPALLRAYIGAAHAGAPNDQFLVPGALGFRNARIYRLHRPDVVRARAEAGRARGRAVLWLNSYEWAYEQPQDLVTSLRRSLRSIGLELVVKKLDDLSRVTAPGAAWDLSLLDFQPDLPDPSDTLNHLFETGYPAADGLTPSATTHSADPALDRDLRAAAGLSGRARLDAYARLDERLARDGAAVIPIGRLDQLDSFSERVGCQTFHPLYGIVLGALCFRR